MFSIRTKKDENSSETIIVVDGDIAGADSERFRGKLEELIDENCPGITLDLRGVGFMDSAGLGTLIFKHLELKDNEKDMNLIVDKDSSLMELFETTKLVKLLNIISTN